MGFRQKDFPRCPYCVVGTQLKQMRVLQNGRQICENFGHIVFPKIRHFRALAKDAFRLARRLVFKR